jgi:hypothetical protein
MSNHCLRLDFIQRSSSLTEELAPFTERQPTLTLRDVTADSVGCPSDLAREPITLVGRKSRTQFTRDNDNV